MLISDVQVNVTEADVQTHVKTEHVHVSLLLLPSVTIAIVMLTFLSISFIRHHRQYMSKRKSQLEHMKASGKRQRIGAPTCFGNSLGVSGAMPPFLLSEYTCLPSHVSVREIQENKNDALPKVIPEHVRNEYLPCPQTVIFPKSTGSGLTTNLNGMTGSPNNIHILNNSICPTENRPLINDLSGIAYADDSSPESVKKDPHISVSDTSTCEKSTKNAFQYGDTPSDCIQKSDCGIQPDSMKGSIINEKSPLSNVFGEFEVYQTPDPQCSENEAEGSERPIVRENDSLDIENKVCTCEPSYSKFNRHNRRFSYLETFLHAKRMDLFRQKKVSDTGENIPLRENEQNIDSFIQSRRKLSNPSSTSKCLVCNKNIES